MTRIRTRKWFLRIRLLIRLLHAVPARIVVALALTLVFVRPQNTDGQNNDVLGFRANNATLPMHSLGTKPGLVWNKAAEPTNAIIVVAIFPSTSAAAEMFKITTNRLPAVASLTLFGESVLLSLPPDRNDWRKEWLSEFEARSTNVFEDSADHHPAFSLVCKAPDVKTAEQIVSQLNNYLETLPSEGLIPPWQSPAKYPAANKAHDELARQTYRNLLAAMQDNGNSDLYAVGRDLRTAEQIGNEASAIELHAKYQLLDEKLREERLENLRNGLMGPVDTDVADLYLRELHAPLQYNHPEMARLLGQFPLVDGRLAPADKRIVASSGSASRDGSTIYVTFVSFYDLVNGPGTLVHWLADARCVDFKYDYIFEFEWQPGLVIKSPGRTIGLEK